MDVPNKSRKHRSERVSENAITRGLFKKTDIIQKKKRFMFYITVNLSETQDKGENFEVEYGC